MSPANGGDIVPSVTRTINTKLVLDGEAAYKAQLAGINAESRKLASEMKLVEASYSGQANSLEALNAKHSVLQRQLDNQHNKLSAHKRVLDEARTAYETYGKQMADYGQQIEESKSALDELKNSTGDTTEEQARLTKEMDTAQEGFDKSAAKQAIASNKMAEYESRANSTEANIKNLGREIDQTSAYMGEAATSADGCATSIDEYGNKVESAGASTANLSSLLASAGIIAGLKKLAEGFADCAKASIEYESAMTGVIKTVDGTPAQIQAISDGIKEMSTVIPATTTEIAAVAEAAGQLGIATDDVLNFAEVMINLGVTTNLSAEEAASSLAKFANITGTAASDYERLGSTIVALGNNFATTEADIVAMATGLASAGTLAGLTESEILALAASMSSVGIQAQAGATAMSQTFAAIEKAAAKGGDSLDEFARIAGMSAEDFAAMWRDDALSAVNAFIGGLGGLEAQGESATLVLDEMGLSGIRQANMLKALALASDTLSQSIGLSSAAWEENTALAAEAALRYGTTESKFQLLENSTMLLKQAIGDALTPALGGMAEAGADAAQWAADFAADNPEVVGAITGTVAAVGLLTGAVTIYTAGAKIAGMVTATLGASMTAVLGPIAAVIAGIGLVAGVLAASVKDANSELNTLQAQTKASAAAYEDAKAAISSQSESIGSLASQLDYLIQTSDGSTGSMQAMQGVMSQLTALVPELTGYIDAETGALMEGWEAVVGLSQAQQEHVLAKEREAQISAELTTAERSLSEARAEMQALEEKGIDLAAIDILMGEGLISLLSEEQLRYLELQQAITGYSDQIETSSEALSAATAETEAFAEAAGAQEDAIEPVIDALAEQAAALGTTKTELAEVASEYGLTADALAAMVAESGVSLDEWVANQEEYASAVKDATDSVVNDFEKVKTGTGQSIDQMIANNDHNAEKTREFTALMSELSGSMSEDVQAYFEKMGVGSLEQLQELRDSGAGKMEELNASMAEAAAAGAEDVDRQWADADLPGAISKVYDEAGNAISNNKSVEDASGETIADAAASTKAEISNSNFPGLGVDMVGGIARGAQSNSGMLANVLANIVKNAVRAAKAAAESNSPSKLTERELGLNMMTGWAQGIEKNVGLVTGALESSVGDTGKVMKNAGELAVKAYAEGINAQKSAAITAMQDTARATWETAKGTLTNYNDLKKELDRARNMEILSEREYFDELKSIRDKYLNPNSEDYLSVTESLYKFEASEHESERKEAIAAYEDYIKAYVDATEKALDEVQSRIDKAMKGQAAMAQSLANYGSLMDTVSLSWSDGSKSEYTRLGDLQSDIDTLSRYSEMLTTLQSKGASASLMDEIVKMDVDEALKYGELLLSKTESQWEDYNEKWEEKQRLAIEIAENFYRDELNALETEYNDLLRDSLDGLKDTSYTSGENTVDGFIDGMVSREDALKATVARIAAIVEGGLQKGLDSHSPSRLTEKYGKYAAQGVGVGWEEEIKNLEAKVMASMPATFGTPAPVQQNQNSDMELLSGMVTTMMAGMGGSGPQPPTVHILQLENGVEIARWLVPDIRAVESQSPQIVSDLR